LQTPNAHITAKAGCPNCSHTISKSEIAWLNSLNIPKKYRQYILTINGEDFKLDGYDPITNTVYEFYGDYWHGNPFKYKAYDIHPVNNKYYGELLFKTFKKEQILKKAGYNVVYIWESDFNKQNKGNK
jgi:G:T-mismatch repair DNA endonuclease (very short patch repair protein)